MLREKLKGRDMDSNLETGGGRRDKHKSASKRIKGRRKRARGVEEDGVSTSQKRGREHIALGRPV